MARSDVRGYEQTHIDKTDDLMRLAQKTNKPEEAIKLYRQALQNNKKLPEK